MEATVANEGFVQGLRRNEARLSAGPPKYRVNDGVILPSGHGELRTRDLVLLAAVAQGEATRSELLADAEMDSPAGRRAFTELVRVGALVRTNAAVTVHTRSHRQMLNGETVRVEGRVFCVVKGHPRKRQVNLDLTDGSRAAVLAYGREAALVARLGPGMRISVTGIKLKSNPCLHVRAMVVRVIAS